MPSPSQSQNDKHVHEDFLAVEDHEARPNCKATTPFDLQTALHEAAAEEPHEEDVDAFESFESVIGDTVFLLDLYRPTEPLDDDPVWRCNMVRQIEQRIKMLAHVFIVCTAPCVLRLAEVPWKTSASMTFRQSW